MLISPIELAAHSDVLEASVVARPHPRWGERAMAFVILRQEAVDKWRGRHEEFEKDLKKHARTKLPGFACPEWVQIVDELPVRALLRHACLALTVAFRKPLQEKFRR